jgi:hypothetical protein
VGLLGEVDGVTRLETSLRYSTFGRFLILEGDELADEDAEGNRHESVDTSDVKESVHFQMSSRRVIASTQVHYILMPIRCTLNQENIFLG